MSAGVYEECKRLIRLTDHANIDFSNTLLVVFIDNYEMGYDAMFYDDDGLKFDRREINIISKFNRRFGLYPLRFNKPNDNLQKATAYTGIYKNMEKMKNKPICMIKLTEALKPKGGVVRYTREHLNSFDSGMCLCLV